MRLFGLIGFPLLHSFSKRYFTTKFEAAHLANCSYQLFELSSIDELPGLLQQHPTLEGLNVTIPYKQQVLPFLTDVSQLPLALKACNCIRIRKGQLQGFNTDIIGFERSLKPLLKPYHTSALVLGNGGASLAVQYVLHKLSIPFEVVSRNPQPSATITYNQLNDGIIASSQIIINTTPLGTFPQVTQCPPINYNAITSQHLLFDLVYNPSTTAFMQQGLQRGATVKNGYEMLVGQAEGSWEIWNEPATP